MILTKNQVRQKYKGISIHDTANIHDGVSIHNSSIIGENVTIYPLVTICENVTISKNCNIHKNCSIYPRVKLHNNVQIGKNSLVHYNSTITPNTVICEGAKIGSNRKNVSHNMVISGIGETKNITAYHCDDGLIINIGCMNEYQGDTIENTRKMIATKYNEDHEYFDAMNDIEKWYNKLKYKNVVLYVVT